MKNLSFLLPILFAVIASSEAIAQKTHYDAVYGDEDHSNTSQSETTIPRDDETGKFKYEKVIQVEGLSQIEIYDRAKNWIVRTLKSGDNIINLHDDNKEAITATGNILLENQEGIYRYENIVLNFKFNIYVKDGRYKIIIDNFMINYDFVYQFPTNRSSSLEDGFKKEGLVKGTKSTNKMYADVDLKIKEMISNLEASIVDKVIATEKDDW